MTTEFNLSERIVDLSPEGYKQSLDAGDVKEFIRLLKEKAHSDPEAYLSNLDDFDSLIDKLAGEKLI